MWAFLTMVLTTLVIVGALLPSHPTDRHNHQVQIIQFWIIMTSYSAGAWFARISLMLSTVRLIPIIFKLRRISELAFVSFLLMCMSVLIAKLHFCASDLSWYKMPSPVCPLTRNTNLAAGELTTFLLADMILVAIPLRLLYRISLPREKRRMLILMFSANIITSIVSVLRVVFLIGSSGGMVSLAIKAEVGTALIVADLAILTPYIYRLVKPEGDFDSKPDTHYRSVQPDGGIVMRRVSDLAPDMRLDNLNRGSTAAMDRSCTAIHLPDRETAVNISSARPERRASVDLYRQKSFVSSRSDITQAKTTQFETPSA
ncbi:hypothetical protein GYMLUDRAFT_42890 [Collybiopsis luxurians FD-317 M1]|uniref:Rhodopsin domain-containing protein n=1 Tax=Collybiopsis luxurians FD-317 M1 TaxID=944289 RepID=A0A0D0BZG7_9AGAR|nr:hypothetical protein GYMLUDRAFT_42890 [Collybiopsis luxurians FD-317 M1]